jgi:hypothetical protein
MHYPLLLLLLLLLLQVAQPRALQPWANAALMRQQQLPLPLQLLLQNECLHVQLSLRGKHTQSLATQRNVLQS